jgi:hypothetical protein
MFIPRAVFDLFRISKESVEGLREDLAAVRAERDLLKLQLATSQNHFDWLRTRINILEAERAQLIEKAYGIKIPVPEIVRTPINSPELNSAVFEDIGDEAAKILGLPVYGS